MKKILSISFVFAICSIFMASCYIYYPGRYAPPKLETAKKPDPVEDYLKLKALFEKYDGKLAADDDTVVKWKDCEYYRLFEFKNHSVAIFPYNWDEEHFDLYIFAGHLKKYDNMLDDIYFTHHSERKEPPFYANETMNLDSDVCKKISFDNFSLGFSQNECIDIAVIKLKESFEHMDISAAEMNERLDYYTKNLWPAMHDRLTGISNELSFQFHSINNKLVWMHFYTKGMPFIAHYSLGNRGKVAVVAEGEFKIPIASDNTKPGAKPGEELKAAEKSPDKAAPESK